MIVRIKFGQGRSVRNARGKNRRLALAAGALLIPASLMAYVLGLWRLTSDLGMTREFSLSGLFSHWQVWIGAAAAMNLATAALNRYGRDGEFHLPSALSFHFGPPRPPREAGRQSARRAKAS